MMARWTRSEVDAERYQALAIQAEGIALCEMNGVKGLSAEVAKANAIAKVLVAEELGLPAVLTALTGMWVIQGRLCISAATLMSLLHRSGLAEVTLTEGDGWCECSLTRRDSGFTFTSHWDMERAKKSGLAGKDNWQHYQPNMLRARAQSEALTVACPDLKGGLYVPEDFGHTDATAHEAEREPRVIDEAEDTTPTGETAKMLVEARYKALVERGADGDKLLADIQTIMRTEKGTRAQSPPVKALSKIGVRAILRILDKAEAALPPREDVKEGEFEPGEPAPEEPPAVAPGKVSHLAAPDPTRWPRGETTPITWWRAVCTDAGLGESDMASLQTTAFGTTRPPDSPDEMAALLAATDAHLAGRTNNGTAPHAT